MNDEELQFILRMRDEAAQAMNRLGRAIDDAADDTESLGDGADRLNHSLDDIIKTAREAAGAIAGIWASARGVTSATQAWASYEMGLVNVVKTTGMAGRELDRFRSGLDRMNRDMNAISTEQLSELASTVGQLGVQGADNILAMTETLAELGVTSDVVGSQGALMLARILNLTGEGAAGARAFGDTLNYLGNNAAATESEILSMASAVAQNGAQFGMASAEVLALAAAMKELDLQEQVSAAVVGRTLRGIDAAALDSRQLAYTNLLRLTQMTREEFEQLRATNPAEVFLRFSEAYQRAAEQGQGAQFLQGFNLNNDEATRVLGTIGNSMEQVMRTFGLRLDDEVNGALTREADAFFEALQNRISGLLKSFQMVFAALGESIAPVVGPIVDGLTFAMQGLATVINALPPGVDTLVAGLVLLAPALVTARLAMVTLQRLLSVVGVNLGSLTPLLLAATTNLRGLASAGVAAARSLLALLASSGGIVTAMGQLGVYVGRLGALLRGLAGAAVVTVMAQLRGVVLAAGIAFSTLSWPVLAVAAALTATAGAVWYFWDSIRAVLALSPAEIFGKVLDGLQWFADLPTMANELGIKLNRAIRDAFWNSLSWVRDAGQAIIDDFTWFFSEADWSEVAASIGTRIGEEITGAIQFDPTVLQGYWQAVVDWWNSPIWALPDNELTVTVTADVDTAAAEQAAVEMERIFSEEEFNLFNKLLGTPGERAELERLATLMEDVASASPASLEAFGVTPEEVARANRLLEIRQQMAADPGLSFELDLGDQIEDAQAVTGEMRAQLELQRLVNSVVTQTGESAQTVATRFGPIITALQVIRRDTAVGEQLAALMRQVDAVEARTQAERDSLEVQRIVTELQREQKDLTEAQVTAIRQQVAALSAARRQAAYDGELRTLQRQIDLTRTMTDAERTRLEAQQRLADFEETNGSLSPRQRAAYLSTQLALGQAQAFSALRATLLPAETAAMAYANALDVLDRALADATISQEEHTRLVALARLQMGTTTDAISESIRASEASIAALGVDRRERQLATALRQLEIDAMREGLDLSNAETRARLQHAQALLIEADRMQRLDQARQSYADMVRGMQEEVALLGIRGRYQEADRNSLRQTNQLRQQGVAVTDEMTAAIQEYNRAMQDADEGQNGFLRWAEGIKDLRVQFEDFKYEAADGLADAITEGLMGSEDAFVDLLNNLRRMAIRMVVDQVLSNVFQSMNIEDPRQSHLDRAQAAADRLAQLGSNLSTPMVNVNAQTVNVGGMGATGLNALNASNINAPVGTVPGPGVIQTTVLPELTSMSGGFGAFSQGINAAVAASMPQITAAATTAVAEAAVGAQNAGLDSLFDYISRYESSGGGYNQLSSFTRVQPGRDLTSMSVNDVLAWQQSNIRAGAASTAAGRFQIINPTLRSLVEEMGLTGIETFNEDLQNEMAEVLMRRRGLDAWRSGGLSDTDFANNLAREWAGLPVVSGPNRGRSHYSGDGLNGTSANPDEFLAILAQTRAATGQAVQAAVADVIPARTDYLRMVNAGGTRSQELDPQLVEAMSYLGDMGIQARVFSGGQYSAAQLRGMGIPENQWGRYRTGSTRHDHGRAADVDYYLGDRRLDWSNPEDIPIFQEIVARGRERGIGGWGAGIGDSYMGSGRVHMGYGSEGTWGAGGNGANAPAWLRDAWSNPGTGRYWQGGMPGAGGMDASAALGSYTQAITQSQSAINAATTQLQTFNSAATGLPGQVQAAQFALQQTGQAGQTAAPQIEQAGQAIQNTASMSQSAQTGIVGLNSSMAQTATGSNQLGGVLMQMIQQVLSASGGGGYMGLISPILGMLFHTGGEVGSARNATRALPAAAWSGAKRYHTGLGNDEYTAILQRGERVLTSEQNTSNIRMLEALIADRENRMADPGVRTGRRGDGVTVNYNISTPDVGGFQRSQGQVDQKTAVALYRASNRS